MFLRDKYFYSPNIKPVKINHPHQDLLKHCFSFLKKRSTLVNDNINKMKTTFDLIFDLHQASF